MAVFDNSSKEYNSENSSRPPNTLIGQRSLLEDKRLSGNESRALNNPQLLSSTAENYNMQLLAHSAQQQQQLLQLEQRQQQENFVHISSGASSQNLSKQRQQERQADEALDNRSHLLAKSSSPFLFFSGKEDGKSGSVIRSLPNSFAVSGHPGVFTISLSSSSVIHASGKSPSNPSNWPISERSTPDFVRGHVRDLSFGSQDSPLLSLQSIEAAKKLASVDHKNPSLPPVVTSTVAEPELKSPLDHPDQLNRQRNRFFSNEPGSISVDGRQSTDDEAPLNEIDKKAAAELGELLEQSENAATESTLLGYKPEIVSVVQSTHLQHFVSSAGMSSASMPNNILQIQQEIARHTPPPNYGPSIVSEQVYHHFLQSANGPNASSVLTPIVSTDNSQIKQEPSSPSIRSGNYFIPSSQNCQGPQAASENLSNYAFQSVITPQQIRDPNSTENVTLKGPSALQTDPYNQMQNSSSSINNSDVLKKPAAILRPRRTSSSSSDRRKSEGNLTCGICGHSFRSTPALNGHMRIHSASDKKHNKNEQQMKLLGAELSPKDLPVRQSGLPSALYEDLNQQPPVAASISGGPVSAMPHSQQYIPEAVNITQHNRAQNALLTIASAANYLKTESSRPVYVDQSSMPQAYMLSGPMLLQQSSMDNGINSTLAENQNAVKSEVASPADAQGFNYIPAYATPYHQGVPVDNINFLPTGSQVSLPPALSPVYGSHQQLDAVRAMTHDDVSANAQNYAHQQGTDSINKQAYALLPTENYPGQYDPRQFADANSLSQLASIAVAAANRDNVPDLGISSGIQVNYSQNELLSTQTESVNAPIVEWVGQPVPAISQQEIYHSSNLAPETSPIQSGHDPFILSVSVPGSKDQQHTRFAHFDSGVPENSGVHRGSVVTWKDSVVANHMSPLLTSYDDSLMQDAVNVASPSKILPNSMMGGNPPTESVFNTRPFRQRHHSEGAHLIKSTETSILKQILHSTVPSVKLREANVLSNENVNKNLTQFNQPTQNNNLSTMQNINVEKSGNQPLSNQSSTAKVEEFWAEPKPLPRRIRRRRHSADCRLLLKSGSLANGRQHQVRSPNKKPVYVPEARVRPRPPPLVIPSSVSTFTSGMANHPTYYQSNLHHRRRPSGDSCSSFSGVNDKIPPYTPPPMLSPRRAGSGLFCTTPVTPMFNRQKSVDVAIPTIPEEDETEDEELIRSSEPKINIGSRFQATIPELCGKDTLSRCRHYADKIWAPITADDDPKIFKHIEQFMELSSSAAVPFGGSNKEYALDCLAQTKGNILAAVRRLIRKKSDIPYVDVIGKKYAGCGRAWSAQEVKHFDAAMLEHRKDFYVISKMVKTRKTAECVERYYHVVKRNRRRIRIPRRFCDQEEPNFLSELADSSEDNRVESFASASSSDEDLSFKKRLPRSGASQWLPSESHSAKHLQKPSTLYQPPPPTNSSPAPQHIAMHSVKTHAGRIQHPSPAASPLSNISNDDQPAQVFTCPVCGKSFAKVKSRNAHMKTHGKQAQEKRRQREEEAARRNRPTPHPRVPTIHQQNFAQPVPVSTTQLFQHPQHPALQQHRVIPRFGGNI